jgi:hypothetical protein
MADSAKEEYSNAGAGLIERETQARNASAEQNLVSIREALRGSHRN